MSALTALLSGVQPQANQAATDAANAALNDLKSKPLNVVVSVDPATQQWLTALAAGITVALVLVSRRKAKA